MFVSTVACACEKEDQSRLSVTRGRQSRRRWKRVVECYDCRLGPSNTEVIPDPFYSCAETTTQEREHDDPGSIAQFE